MCHCGIETFRAAEIIGGIIYRSDFPGGNIAAAQRSVVIGINLESVFQYAAPGEVEKSVICQIDNGIRIGGSLIVDPKAIIIV